MEDKRQGGLFDASDDDSTGEVSPRGEAALDGAIGIEAPSLLDESERQASETPGVMFNAMSNASSLEADENLETDDSHADGEGISVDIRGSSSEADEALEMDPHSPEQRNAEEAAAITSPWDLRQDNVSLAATAVAKERGLEVEGQLQSVSAEEGVSEEASAAIQKLEAQAAEVSQSGVPKNLDRYEELISQDAAASEGTTAEILGLARSLEQLTAELPIRVEVVSAAEPVILARADLCGAGEDAAFPPAASTSGVSDQKAASGEGLPFQEPSLLGSQGWDDRVDQHGASLPAALKGHRSFIGATQGPHHLIKLNADESLSEVAAHLDIESAIHGMPVDPETQLPEPAIAIRLSEATRAAEGTPDLALDAAGEERGEARYAHPATPESASTSNQGGTGRESSSESIGEGDVGEDTHIDRLLPASTDSGGLVAEGEESYRGDQELGRHQNIPGETAQDWHSQNFPASTEMVAQGGAGGHTPESNPKLRLIIPEVEAEDWHHDSPPAIIGRGIPAEEESIGRETVSDPEHALYPPREVPDIAEGGFPGSEGDIARENTSEMAQAQILPEVVAEDWGEDLDRYENADWHDLGGHGTNFDLAITHSSLEKLADGGGSVEDGIQQDAQG
jgi:hypothetical protein